MVCPKCAKRDIEPSDAFCRHCGFSLAIAAWGPESAGGVAEPKSVTATNSDGSKGLLLLGAAILVLVPLIILATAPWMGWLNFVGSVLPWFFGALALAGFATIFIGLGLYRAH